MPEWKDELRRRLKGARLRGAAESDVMEELSQHLDDRYAELCARNVEPDEARRIALEELEEDHVLGTRVRQAQRESPEPVVPGAPVSGVLAGIATDVRHAARVLRRTPGFTLIAALVIALGIGANTAMFSIVNAVLLRPLPGVQSPAQLTFVHTSDYSGPIFGASSYPDFEAMRGAGIFEDAAAWVTRPFNVTVGERGVRVLGEAVSPNYFAMLGVAPLRGRFFGEEEAAARGDATVAVLGHAFWQERFGGSDDVIGRTLRINGSMLTVIGVAPPEFRGMLRGLRMDVFVPATAPPSVSGGGIEERGHRGFNVAGRMRDGSTAQSVQAQLNGLAAQLHGSYAEWWTDVNERPRVLTATPESETRVPRGVRTPILGMFGALMSVVMVVLLIATSNVANLMLTRAASRSREMGVRLALGATRGRVVRQLLTESGLLALLGGVGGVLLALWAMQAVNRVTLPIPVPFALDVALDLRVLFFAAATTIATGILFGILPALQASRAPAPMMKDGDAARPRMRLRHALVVLQVTASLVLLAGSGLLLRTLVAAGEVDTGLATNDMLLVPFDLETEGYTDETTLQLMTQLQQRVAAIPGVAAAAVAQHVPLSFTGGRRNVHVEGYERQPGEDMEIAFNAAGPGYFDAVGIEVRGRAFDESDHADAPGVAIVNEAFVQRYWGGGNPIGRRIGMFGDEGPLAEVIGVVANAKYNSLTEEALPYFYYSWLQQPSTRVTLHVRTPADLATIAPVIRREIRALVPGMPVPEIITLRDVVGLAVLPQRVGAFVLGAMGVLALLIAGVGLYGVISYGVARRTREFGIRAALGAVAADVQRMVVLQGVRLALVGVVIGTTLALAIAWAARALLLVSPFDPLAIGAVVVLLTATAALASWIPARRATRVDPQQALRSE